MYSVTNISRVKLNLFWLRLLALYFQTCNYTETSNNCKLSEPLAVSSTVGPPCFMLLWGLWNLSVAVFSLIHENKETLTILLLAFQLFSWSLFILAYL